MRKGSRVCDILTLRRWQREGSRSESPFHLQIEQVNAKYVIAFKSRSNVTCVLPNNAMVLYLSICTCIDLRMMGRGG